MTRTMKKIFTFMSALMAVLTFCASCTNDDMEAGKDVGYVKLNIETLTSTNTRALDREKYNPKQLAVVIKDAEGNIVKQTDDHTQWTEALTLPVGDYTITASSNGFDGKESGFDIPYYAGSTTITVGQNTSQTVNITCTLATVKVTVKFSERFKKVFSEAKVNVSSAVSGISPLDFIMSDSYDSNVAGYFPVGNITAKVSVKSAKGEFSSSKTFRNVKARDHYIINYDVAEGGESQITVVANENGNVYTYNIDVADFETTLLDVTDISALAEHAGDVWTDHALLSAVVSGIESFDVSKAYFEYAEAGSEIFSPVAATEDAPLTRANDGIHNLKAELSGLTPGTSYTYRLVYDDGTDRFTSKDCTFETEAEAQLPNAGMEDWVTKSKVVYPCSNDDYTANGTWWDSSNTGTATGLAALLGALNTTNGSKTVFHGGAASAELKSNQKASVFAAASLFAGKFNALVGTSGAKLDWGRPFTSRPKSISVWVNYSTGAMNYVGSSLPESVGAVKGETLDLFSGYVALVHVDTPNTNGTAFTVDNTRMSTFPDWNTDERIVAYAKIPDEECVATNGEWKNINLQLNYHNTNVKPTHIIMVFSASKYGDYFTGSTSSKLYVDDIELKY